MGVGGFLLDVENGNVIYASNGNGNGMGMGIQVTEIGGIWYEKSLSAHLYCRF